MAKFAVKAYIVFDADDMDDAVFKAQDFFSAAGGDSIKYDEIIGDSDNVFDINIDTSDVHEVVEAREIAERQGWV